MIQISALPATALPIAGDQPFEPGTESRISEEFAAILAMQAGPPSPMPEAIGENFAQQAASSLSLTGNPGGKILPVAGLPADPAEEVQPELAVPYLPFLAPAAPIQPAAAPNDEVTLPETRSVQQLALPQSFFGAVTSFAGQPKRLDLLAASTALPGTAMALPSARPITMPAIVIEPESVATAFSPAAVEMRMPLASPAASSNVLTADAQMGTAMRIAMLPGAPASSSPAPSGDGAALAQSSVASALAGIGKEGRPQAAGTRLPSIPIVKGDADRPSEPALSSRADIRSTGEEAAMTIAADAPQPVTAPPQERATQAPSVSATAATPSNHRAEAPADFSTLVDRLVAAREAAQGSLGAQAVHAALAHAEFGKVSLRFEQQDGALNVAMASADPDFARSVLAAAPQQEAGNGDMRGQTSRQDSGQSMAQPHSQPQGQANGQAPQRSQPSQPQFQQPGQASDADSHSEAGTQAPRQRGIFA